MIFNPTSRVRVRDAERLWLAKFILRIITLLLGLLAIGCTAWAFDSSTGRYVGSFRRSTRRYLEASRWLLLWQFITLGISVVWNIANLIVRLSRPRPLHPGANVGMDLILWLGLIATGLLALFAGLGNLYSQRELGNRLHQIGVVELVGSTFTFLAVLLHFTLFVWACVDVHRRNNGNVDRRAAAIAQNLIAEMAERGVLPSGQQSQFQQHAAPSLAPEGIHVRESSPYDLSSRESMPLRHPTDERGPMGKRSYLPVSTNEMDSSFPAPPRKHPMRGTASEDSIRGIERGGIV
ncbi:MAG: hypothetical protein Q9187_008477 [Circinaria calcarea]